MTARPNRTVYLVDDNAEFRASAQWWLTGAGYDVKDFACPLQALETLQQIAGDRPLELLRSCLLLDVRMPGLSGLDLHDKLVEAGLALKPPLTDMPTKEPVAPPVPPLPVVYMTGHGDVPLAVAAMQKGAITVLEKPFADDALEHALERAFAAAESSWARAQMSAIFEAMPEPPITAVPPVGPEPTAQGRLEYQRRLESLTQRQREVLQGIVAGKLTKTIAYETGLSSKTVEFHRKCVMSKMGARTSLCLVRMVMQGCVSMADDDPPAPAHVSGSRGYALERSVA
jgi:two-component system, LuxR family, response regulator FixJ